MKTTKKLLSILLAMVMLFTLALPAFAADEGTITITNATIGTEYSVYKIFDATYGEGNTAAYTISGSSKWYNKISEATTLFKLTATASTSSESESNQTFVVEVLGTDAQIKDWFQKLTNLPDADKTEKAAGATVTFSGLGRGYFMVRTASANALITLTNANPDQQIIDKNQTPGGSGDKKEIVTGEGQDVVVEAGDNGVITAEIGDTVNYKVTYTATNYNGEKQIEKYTVTDVMGAGLKLNIPTEEGASAVSVTVDGNAVEPENMKLNSVSDNGFTLELTWAKKDADPATTYTSVYNTGAATHEIVVTYSATVTDSIAMNGNGAVNTANVNYTYTGDTTPGGNPWSSTATVYSYAAAIRKIDEKNEALAGAEFVLQDAAGNQVFVTGSEGNYVVTQDDQANVPITSPANGMITIKGLKAATYKLVETKAPNGYNLATSPVVLTPTKDTAATTTIWYDAEGNVVDENEAVTTVTTTFPVFPAGLVNYRGTVLPSTGGIGTTIFYVVGGLLVLGAAVVLISKKRMGNQQ